MAYEIHKCKYLPVTGVCVACPEIKEPIWMLYIRREAIEQDLEENHYLETIGQTIWTTEIEIICCPFCGEHLSNLENRDLQSYGKFQHTDSCRW